MGKEVKEMETKNLLDEQSEIFNVIVSNADANRKTTIPILLSRMCEIERELTLRENRWPIYKQIVVERWGDLKFVNISNIIKSKRNIVAHIQENVVIIMEKQE